VALRVAEEVQCDVGGHVGYSIRFEDMTSASTKIKFMTDGMLLREALVDPLLSRYSVIMVDEAHERSMSTDVLIGLLKKIARKRPELRIIVSSATLQADEFLQFFSQVPASSRSEPSNPVKALDCKIMSLDGRAYPVDLLYLEEAAESYVDEAVKAVFKIHEQEGEGDILVFLTGRDEIENAIEKIAEQAAQISSPKHDLLPLPMYAGLTVEQQLYAFEPAPENTRKVILSTNIAEASVTIEGIVYVIDTGYAKLRTYNPVTGIETLAATPVSKASATQRAGRAGRTRPGKCFRLYTEESFDLLPEVTVPELQRSNLAPLILQLKALGIDNIARFEFLTPPPSALIVRGLEMLYSLDAVDDYARLSKPLGVRMAEIALEPMMAKTLLSAQTFGCLEEILSIAAMLSLQGSVWFSHEGEREAFDTARRKFAAEEGDHVTLLNVYQAFTTKGRRDAKWCRDHCLNYKSMNRAVSIRNQLKRNLERYGIAGNAANARNGSDSQRTTSSDIAPQIRRCLTSGFFAHAARMQVDGTFRTTDGKTVLHPHPSSLMFNRKADWVVFHEVVETSSKIFIRDITKIEKSWLVEYSSGFYRIV
jgi:ATP-dependent RNA helicase DDX35